jgi:hypothetical protein
MWANDFWSFAAVDNFSSVGFVIVSLSLVDWAAPASPSLESFDGASGCGPVV